MPSPTFNLSLCCRVRSFNQCHQYLLMVKLALLALMMFTATNAVASQCNVKVLEEFDDFFTRFSTDKQFSMQRTIYPLKNKLWSTQIEESSFKITYTTFEEDKRNPILLTYLRENHLEHLFTKINQKESLIKIYKPDTDWLLNFYFQRRGHCWYLYETEDFSVV